MVSIHTTKLAEVTGNSLRYHSEFLLPRITTPLKNCEKIVHFFTDRIECMHMAYTCVNAHGVGEKQRDFLTHLDSALAHTLAHIVYELTTRNRSLTLCLFTNKMCKTPS